MKQEISNEGVEKQVINQPKGKNFIESRHPKNRSRKWLPSPCVDPWEETRKSNCLCPSTLPYFRHYRLALSG
jgi:GT2 family glycosyltransferase